MKRQEQWPRRWWQWIWLTFILCFLSIATALAFLTQPELTATPRGAVVALLALAYLGWNWQWWIVQAARLHANIHWGLLAWTGNLALSLALCWFSSTYVVLLWALGGATFFYLHLPLAPAGMTIVIAAIIVLQSGGVPHLPHNIEEWGNLILLSLALGSWVTAGVGFDLLIRQRVKNEQLIRDLRASQEQLRLAATQEHELVRLRERERLARDLHDNVGHALVLASVKLEAAQRLARVDRERAGTEIDATKQLLRETMNELRRTVTSLRAEPQEDQSLAELIAEQARTIARQTDLQARVNCAEIAGLSAAQEEALTQVAREALTNIVKHAGATAITVMLAQRDGVVRLEVSDNGRGLATNGVIAGAHFGIRGMHERMDLVDGQLIVTAAPGGGTLIRAELPVVTGQPMTAQESNAIR